jgi:flagella basal body P-ring formation protein FlgA
MPALRANVTVTDEIVRIGDLVENSGPVADVPIFRAPDLGTRGAVPTARVVEAIRPHQLIGIDTRGLSEVVVTRASRAIGAQEISARIAKAMEANTASAKRATSRSSSTAMYARSTSSRPSPASCKSCRLTTIGARRAST